MRLKYFLTDVLVKGVFNRDTNSIKKLINTIRRNCMVCLSIQDAEDVAHEVFADIWKNRSNPKMQNHPGSYATSINRGKIIDAWRKMGNVSKVMVSDSEQSPEGDSSGISDGIGSCDPIQADLLEYNELFGKIIEIGNTADTEALRNGYTALNYLIDGLSYSEIAEIMGKPESTVKSWVSRYRDYLCSKLEKYGWDYEDLKKAMGF